MASTSHEYIGPMGGAKGYSTFDDSEWLAKHLGKTYRSMVISSVSVWASEAIIFAIQALYRCEDIRTGKPCMVSAPKHGGLLMPELGWFSPSASGFYSLRGYGKSSHASFALRNNNEYFCALEGGVKHVRDGVNADGFLVLDSLRLAKTNGRTTEWMARPPGRLAASASGEKSEGGPASAACTAPAGSGADPSVVRLEAPAGKAIVALFGSCGAALDSVGIICAPTDTFADAAARAPSTADGNGGGGGGGGGGATTAVDVAPGERKRVRPPIPPEGAVDLAVARASGSVLARDADGLSKPRLMISYRVPEAGSAALGGDGTVLWLRDAMERKGFDVFIAEEKLAGGQKWAAEIQQSILNAHAIIVVCTPTYGETTWTYRELQLADNHVSECTRRLRGGTKEAKRLFDRMTCNFRQTKPIIPLWHSGVYPPKAVEIFFSGLQRVPAGDRPLVDLRARHQNGRSEVNKIDDQSSQGTKSSSAAKQSADEADQVVDELCACLKRIGVAP